MEKEEKVKEKVEEKEKMETSSCFPSANPKSARGRFTSKLITFRKTSLKEAIP